MVGLGLALLLMAATVAALVAEGDTGADADTVLQNDADATAGAIVRTREVLAARENMIKVREDLMASARTFKETREKLVAANASVGATTSVTMMEKAALRRTLVAQAKVVLQNQADSLTKKTDEMRARGLIVAADKLAAIAQLRTQAGTATDGTKLAEVSLRLRAKWADIMADAYTDHAKQLNARFLATIESVSRIVTRLEAVSVKLKASGHDTTKLDAGITRIKADLETLQSTHAALKAEFDAATTPEAKAKVIYKARRVMMVAKARLQADIVLVRHLVALQTRLNSGTQADITAATTDVAAAEAALDAQASLETQIAQAETQAAADAQVNVEAETDAQTGGDDQ